MADRKVWFHWQNLNKHHGYTGSGVIHGRAWLHLWAWVLNWEWHFWSKSCHVSVTTRDYDDSILSFAFAIPPISLYFNIMAPWGSRFQRMMPSGRECRVAIHDWAIWINPWSKCDEWAAKDPWWVRGLTFHIDDFILGSQKCKCEEMRPREPVEIHIDGRVYRGEAKFERRTWKRPRWFAKHRDSTSISMEQGHGLPHAGKGTCDYNCGDDALYGWGSEGFGVQKAIEHGIETVNEYRRRYGQASCVA